MQQTLNGKWLLLPDPEKKGITEHWYDKSTFQSIKLECIETEVPSNWNIHPSLEKYEGCCWYFKEFEIPNTNLGREKIHRIRFNGSNYLTKVYLNGHLIGENEGGFLPFTVIADSQYINGSGPQFLAVSVDNSRTRNGIPSFNMDWYNYGGIHRDVMLEVIPSYRIERVYVTPQLLNNNLANISVSFDIINFTLYLETQMQSTTPSVNAKIYYIGNRSSKVSQKINRILLHEFEFSIDQIQDMIIKEPNHTKESKNKKEEKKKRESKKSLSNSEENQGEPDNMDDLGKDFDNIDEDMESADFPQRIRVKFTQEIQEPVLWCLENPELYEIELFLNGSPHIYCSTFGIREIKTHGVGLYLNRKLLKFKGVSLHEEQVPFGRHYPEDMRRKEIIHIKELGFNTIRSSHYSHDEVMVKIADEEGVLIFEEIPLYWDCTFHEKHTQLLAIKMLKALMDRDYNHPSVIVWSVGNEIPVEQPPCKNALQNFLKFTRSLDSSRLVTYVTARFWNDTLRRETDLICQNEYLGWYFGRVNQINILLESIYPTAPKQPWVITEFGASADYYAEGADKGKKYSMEYQYYFLKRSIEIFNAKPWINGFIIWIYRDFKSPLRTNRFQRGYNRKGIVTEDNKEKISAVHSHKLINAIGKNIKRHPLLGRMVYVLVKPLVNVGMMIGQKFADKSIKQKIDEYYSKKPQID